MTFKEKLMKEHPEAIIDAAISGGGCPSDFGYEECSSYCHSDDVSCHDCWDREIPEEGVHCWPGEPGPEGYCGIRDSGDRTEFATGAVRDMREGKGRCDLMPLEVVAYLYPDNQMNILHEIKSFQKTNNTTYLYGALCKFADEAYNRNATTMFLEVAKHFEEGAKKYGENNWQKGIPVKCYIDSAVRHYLKYLRGDKDEPHDRAFVWNILCCIWTCKHHPELNDYAKKEGSEG
jgi:hypothetical protein